nr:hypothetical protein Hi04_10k_c377_00035 [uncultured bacterium]
MRSRLISLAATSLVVLTLASPVKAQSASGGAVVVVPAGFAETAVASCAGGAMIGYLAVLATGAPSPIGTAALFCGLSVAATTASTVAVWTWHKTTWFLY